MSGIGRPSVDPDCRAGGLSQFRRSLDFVTIDAKSLHVAHLVRAAQVFRNYVIGFHSHRRFVHSQAVNA